MPFVVVTGMTLMDTGYGWKLHMDEVVVGVAVLSALVTWDAEDVGLRQDVEIIVSMCPAYRPPVVGKI